MTLLGRRALLEWTAAATAWAAAPAWAAPKEASSVLTRPIPRTGEPLPAIGMGTWQTFDVGATPAERKPLLEVLRRFFSAGARLIDSSPMYGRSESVVGDLLEEGGLQGSAFLATKVWTTGKERGIAQMEESFRRMKTARMDLMQVHNLLDVRTHLDTLRAWKQEGRIRYLGVTHYQRGAFDELARLIETAKLDFVQLPYSVGVRDAEKRLLPLAKDQGVAVIVMRPFEGGSLFSEARGKPLPPVAAELKATSWAQLFLKFILAHPAVTCAIPATSKPDHVADNLRALHGPLPDADQRRALLKALGL